MITSIIHLSDIHYRADWPENLDIVLNAFFNDLRNQMAQLPAGDKYIIFSGDIVQAGAVQQQYNSFYSKFSNELDGLNLPTQNRICVPGNHDVSQAIVAHDWINHKGVVSQNLDEYKFNEYLSNISTCVFCNKFENYLDFASNFAGHGINSRNSLLGTGYLTENNIGIYCLNSALCSSGGFQDKGDAGFQDKRRLAIATRNLQAWNSSCKAARKVLVMHHPVEWLTEWAEKEITLLLRNNFDLCLSGHSHDQDVFHQIHQQSSLINCSAPPLFTDKNQYGEIGYSIISICPDTGVQDIKYRQWTKHRSFVSGVNFSNTDDGKVVFKQKKTDYNRSDEYAAVERILTKELDDALCSFSEQPIIWVDPIINTKPDNFSSDREEGKDINLNDIIEGSDSTIISAPPQFGLTCLARSLVKEAWCGPTKSVWIYIDYNELKLHTIEKKIKEKLSVFGCDISNIKCIILDSLVGFDNSSTKILEKLCRLYSSTRLIIMHTMTDSMWFNSVNLPRNFDNFYLRSLPRNSIRKVVTDYNGNRHIADEDILISKVISDLEMLNIHRTPLNCLTLLKATEVDFDESPVNRTEMIKRVLFLLFNMDEIPNYKSRPDLKDCEYVLGFFCEILIREKKVNFTRDYFEFILKEFCKNNLLDIEIGLVFDVLHKNNIIVHYENEFRFKFLYWVFYFAAHRMHQDKKFADFIYQNRCYAAHPEIIEFYSGIDRRREDALLVLLKDLKEAFNLAVTKCGVPTNFNPYQYAKWKATKETMQTIHSEISSNVMESKLPDIVKDQYADRYYNPSKPYNQELSSILDEYSLEFMLQSMKATSVALRNSDFVTPEIKKQALNLILECWEHMTKMIIILSPILAAKGSVIYEGFGCYIKEKDFEKLSDSFEERINWILPLIPINIVNWYHKFLFSQKMGALLISQMKSEKSEIKKHELALLLIRERPRNWKEIIEQYIVCSAEKSFYLADVLSCLLVEYRFSYAPPSIINDIKFLVKKVIAKHHFGKENPGPKWISRVSDDNFPEREITA